MSASAEGIAEIVRAVGGAITDEAIAHVSDRQFGRGGDHRLLLAGVDLCTARRYAPSPNPRLIDEALRRAPHAAERMPGSASGTCSASSTGWSTDPAKDTQRAVDCTARALDINPESAFRADHRGFAHNNLLRRMDLAQEPMMRAAA